MGEKAKPLIASVFGYMVVFCLMLTMASCTAGYVIEALHKFQ